MGGIFSPNSPTMIFLGRVADIVILSLLWLVCSIPIITIGPATSALYYVTLKMVRDEDGSIVKSFFHGLKDNLGQGIILTVIFLACGFFLYYHFVLIFAVEGTLQTVMKIVALLLLACFASIVIYTFPLQARFRNTIFGTLKNAYILSVTKLPSTIMLLLIHMLPVLFMQIFPDDTFVKVIPLVVCLFPGGIAYISSIRFVAIFSDGKKPESGN